MLMSATISAIEVHELGLDTRRTLYVDVDSPIPAANRPVFVDPVCNMSFATRRDSIPLLAARLRDDLENRRGAGIIHCTYAVAALLRPILRHPRLRYHTKYDRAEQYERFRRDGPGRETVLVASGMGEGIDLPHNAARWQIVTQVPYPSLADPGVARKCELNPKWFSWEAVKGLQQMFGRVCRSPDDYGETWIYDSQFQKLWDRTGDMWPAHIQNSVRFIRPNT